MTENKNFYRASAEDFRKIPGSPVAYWISKPMRNLFALLPAISQHLTVTGGMTTADNDRFLRLWHEVSTNKSHRNCKTRNSAKVCGMKWFPYNKGGAYRKWFGNRDFHVNWYKDGEDIITTGKSFPRSKDYYFQESLTYTATSSSFFGIRYSDAGFIFDAKGSSCFASHEILLSSLGFLASKISSHLLASINPTIEFQTGNLSILPFQFNATIIPIVNGLISISRTDWDSYETSWDFEQLPLLRSGKWEVESGEMEEDMLPTSHFPLPTCIAQAYSHLRAHWLQMTLETQKLETENNRIFIEAYGLQDELTPEVPLKEITLTCNPYYRYGVEECEVGSEKWEAVEKRLLEDTMKEFISYAVGCMFGRYSLDKPGLILANAGETVEDYIRKVGSGKCEVRSEEKLSTPHGLLHTSHSPLPTNTNGVSAHDSEELSRIDSLAEGDGLGGNCVPGNENLSQRGDLRIDQSNPQGSGVDSIQHSGRASSKINSGIQELSIHSSGITSGSRDADHDCPAIELHNSGTDGSNSQPIRRNQKNGILANVETVLTPHSPLPTPHLTFPPDEDNVIPILDGDWFTDDITERFYKFLRITFGEEHFDENRKFIEDAIGKDIRKYFLKDFYNDHVRRYKKRPIYWLFSSPKGAFNALIYMHRYRPDTVSSILNGYLREFRTKLTATKSHLEAVSISTAASAGEKTKALKDIENIRMIIEEIDVYERDILYPLATKQIEIDLDDGVKVNYQKFGTAVKKIVGLDSKEED